MCRVWFLCLMLLSGVVCAAPDPQILRDLASEDFDTRIAAIQSLGVAGDDDARRILQALEEDALAVAGGRLVILDGEQVLEAATGAPITPAPDYDAITVNNRVRQAIAGARAAVEIFSPERRTRLAAARVLQEAASERLAPVFDKALAAEQDPEIRNVLVISSARVQLGAADAAKRLKAVQTLGESADPNVRALLLERSARLGDGYAEPDAEVRNALDYAIRAIDRRIAVAEGVGTLFTGLSLGSILLLAALGLAITYGVMGVINMAHGELLMVGAYATYLVQGLFRQHLPGMVDWYVVAAVPAAFLAAALVGVAMERTVIRFLYGRPLESLLATWGLSLVLIQAARVIFGPQNVEVANPAWMSGGVALVGEVVLPWNRIVIVGFAGFVLMLIWLMMQKTRLGMFVRAVTQNRAMAGCVGVPTARVDTLAFALGAGVAGLGGVALSQIANVGPAMGQGYIVDAFLVVVVGGVGQLAGAVWAALGLGLISKFLEGWAGAVIAKILVLALIIVFIQKRPQGLFSMKGRFVEN
jgi:urea transport system permease protein